VKPPEPNPDFLCPQRTKRKVTHRATGLTNAQPSCNKGPQFSKPSAGDGPLSQATWDVCSHESLTPSKSSEVMMQYLAGTCTVEPLHHTKALQPITGPDAKEGMGEFGHPINLVQQPSQTRQRNSTHDHKAPLHTRGAGKFEWFDR